MKKNQSVLGDDRSGLAMVAMHALVTGLGIDGHAQEFQDQARKQGMTVSQLIADMSVKQADALIERLQKGPTHG